MSEIIDKGWKRPIISKKKEPDQKPRNMGIQDIDNSHLLKKILQKSGYERSEAQYGSMPVSRKSSMTSLNKSAISRNFLVKASLTNKLKLFKQS